MILKFYIIINYKITHHLAFDQNGNDKRHYVSDTFGEDAQG